MLVGSRKAGELDVPPMVMPPVPHDAMSPRARGPRDAISDPKTVGVVPDRAMGTVPERRPRMNAATARADMNDPLCGGGRRREDEAAETQDGGK